MSKRIGNTIIIEPEEDSKCEYCAKLAETRPYGKNGARICYECGMKNKEETEKNMEIILFGKKENNLN